MQKPLDEQTPAVADSAFVSEMSYLIGDVVVSEDASLWPFTCLRGDGGTTVVGTETNVQEFTMLHGAVLGDEVTVGHNVVVDYATVEDHSLVGMQSAVLRGATVESNCLVAAGAVVLQGQTIPEGHLAYGAPAQTKPLTDDQRDEIARVHEHYVELGQRYKETGQFE
ncbi:Carbonic anhydrase or acetyltransferase, isoleucine patch superfamily [Halogranum amylolyticum]|uniref:Carbonic anhydrase or acetyltransferase, isoleucine patch superfamily n=1 Tax=Halogranum amylolyticum TaxID=660520 RepID=A0A1H8UL38_9EURY|nr:gamma carbonic anhydrase family protein [Halogranum amylolyticum]SEP03950.1 Carbonic anhydrase or acetyltransferase, isoleucine patch superfamily [Halogranum amylolyticum]